MLNPYEGGKFKVTSVYGTRTLNGSTAFHSGLDLVGESSKNLLAICDGTITQSRIITDKSNLTWQWGNYVCLKADTGEMIFYCHLSERKVKKGDRVKAGDIIGVEGNTGYSFGSHCHLEIRNSANKTTDQVNTPKFTNIPNKIGTCEIKKEDEFNMVSIRKMDLPKEKYKIKCPYTMEAETIVIHNTENDAPAANEVKYMQSNNNYTSFHFAVDDIEAIQCLPLDRNAFHAGDGETGKGNRKGIGIEICYSKSTSNKEKFKKAQENAAELTAYLLHEKGWGKDLKRVTKHQDYSGKYCPRRTLSDYGWDYFLNLVKEKYEKVYEEGQPMTVAEKTYVEGLEKEIVDLKNIVKELQNNQKVYHYWKEIPQWAYEPLMALYKAGYFQGASASDLNLGQTKMEMLVILARVLKADGKINY